MNVYFDLKKNYLLPFVTPTHTPVPQSKKYRGPKQTDLLLKFEIKKLPISQRYRFFFPAKVHFHHTFGNIDWMNEKAANKKTAPRSNERMACRFLLFLLKNSNPQYTPWLLKPILLATKV